MNLQRLVSSCDVFNGRSYWLYFFFLLIYACYAHLYFGDYDAKIALGGWSALDFSNSVLYPENFVRDYPGGSWSSGNSLLSWVYPGIQSIGLSVELTLAALIMLEMIVLSAGAIYLMQTLFKRVHPIAILSLTALLILSWVRLSNLARFGNPYFHGQFYGYADGLGLIAIALYFRARYFLSALVLIVSFTIHPLKTLFALSFISGLHLWNWRLIFTFRQLVPYILVIIFAVLWMLLWLDIGSTETGLTDEQFFRYAPLLNSHWFPQDLHIFDVYHMRYTTAFLSALLVFSAVLFRCDLPKEKKGQLMFGMIALAILTITGILSAFNEVNPTLVKACFQRATVLMLTIVTIIVAWQVITDIFSGRWWYGGLGIGLLSIAFFEYETWPVILAIIYVVSVLTSKDILGTYSLWSISTLVIFLFGIISYELLLYYFGYQNEVSWMKQINWSVKVILITAVVSLARFFFTGRIATIKHNGTILLLLLGLSFSVYSWGNSFRLLNLHYVEQGKAYESAQLWARDKTANDSLFIVDPCISYGWRDYSIRSSFGTVHEWFKTGWLYFGDQQSLYEGIRRGSRLGIEVDKIIPIGTRQIAGKTSSEFCSIARNTFYQPDGKNLAAIAVDYNIQYVVMDKSQARKFGKLPSWPKAYENKYYIVLIPPHEQKS